MAATINIELTQEPIDISKNLEADNFYTFQLISTLGATAHYILVDGTQYPAPHQNGGTY